MSVLNENTIIGASAASSGYEIPNSLRFNDDDSAYLSRTPSTASNQKTWTWSGCVKRGNLGTTQALFSSGAASQSSNRVAAFFLSTDVLWYRISIGGTDYTHQSTQVFRDPSAPYHLVIQCDTTQASSADRKKVYVNGEEITSWTTEQYPNQNADTTVNNTVTHGLGSSSYSSGGFSDSFADLYLAEVNFIDGLALTPADFGEFGDYGEWKPKKYTGAYGTNGFYLDFKNSGSLGNDANGSNNWTPTNLAATDQMLDSPTNNFATLNPLFMQSDAVLSEGNLKAYTPLAAVKGYVSASIGVGSGSMYFEMLVEDSVLGSVGVVNALSDPSVDSLSLSTRWLMYGNNGKKYNNDGGVAYGSQLSLGDIVSVAVDADAGKIWWGVNGTWLASGDPSAGTGEAYSNLTGVIFPAFMDVVGSAALGGLFNFGQDSSFAGNKTAQGNSDANGIGDFYYAPPTGFLALCTQNLPEPTVIPSEHFNTVLYTGDGTASHAVTGVGFQPDLTWIKERTDNGSHQLIDSIRGVTKRLESNSTGAEAVISNGLLSFDSDGFTYGDYSNGNQSGITHAAWNWKANGAGVSNTDGSITSTVSANVDAGFSIIGYTGTGAAATVGHGLTLKEPDLIIVKDRDDTSHWYVYNKDVGNTKALFLNLTNAEGNTGAWDNTTPSSTVFSLETSIAVNASADTYIAYAFHSVDGYSKFGSYTGNGDADGPFVHCGFKPAFVMLKRSDSDSSGHWLMKDSKRDESNGNTLYSMANRTDADTDNTVEIDYLSNGFKQRSTNNVNNANASTYIFLAFAESPFKYSNAR
jgi:hypothetical protein